VTRVRLAATKYDYMVATNDRVGLRADENLVRITLIALQEY
jgi:hypothetical protein